MSFENLTDDVKSLLNKAGADNLRSVLNDNGRWDWVGINTETYEVTPKKVWEHNIFGYITPQNVVKVSVSVVDEYLNGLDNG